MRPNAYRTTTVGLVIAFALALAALGILAVGREEGLFRDRVYFTTDFPNVDGLGVGAPVRLIGVQVGVVSGVRFTEDITKQEVDVTFAVDRAYRERMREGTTAVLKNLTYLSGEKYIELRPGPADRPLIPEGGYVESPRGEFEQFISQTQTIATNLEEISGHMTTLLNDLNSGQSVLSQLIKDPEFGRLAVVEAGESVQRINRMLGNLEHGRGLMGRLLTDDAFADEVLGRLSSVTAHIEEMARRVEAGEGIAGQLLRSDSELATSLSEGKGAIIALRELVEGLRAGRGLAGRLITDEEWGRTQSERLAAMLADLESITSKIDEGRGTLGLLINEAELHNQATSVIGGVSDSEFLRWVARRVRDKNVKKQIEEWADKVETTGAPPPGGKP